MLMHKSQLHELVHKRGWPNPDYSHVRQGAAHLPKFQACVIVNSVAYHSLPGFTTLKAAEHDAARAALAEISKHDADGSNISAQKNGLCKNALQEYAQKSGLPLPVYKTERSGEDHDPAFTATVEVGGTYYTGGPARTKKEAEFKAAKVAMLAIDIVPQLPQPIPDALRTEPVTESSSRKKKRARSSSYPSQSNARIKVEPLEPRYRSVSVSTLNEPAYRSVSVSTLNEPARNSHSDSSHSLTLSLLPPSILTEERRPMLK